MPQQIKPYLHKSIGFYVSQYKDKQRLSRKKRCSRNLSFPCQLKQTAPRKGTCMEPPRLARPQVDAPRLARHILASMAPVQRARADQKEAAS